MLAGLMKFRGCMASSVSFLSAYAGSWSFDQLQDGMFMIGVVFGITLHLECPLRARISMASIAMYG